MFDTFLPAGGEMADRIRAFDWAATPLGPPERWSTSLKTIVSVVVSSRHPMFLWWGPDLIQFYNDAYRPSLGEDRHPAALGAAGRVFWAEISHLIGPQIDAVMTRGEPTWNEDHLVPIFRDGAIREVYWTYGYSPVRDDDGTIRGTLVVVQEQTGRVVGARRLRMLRDLAARALAARTEEDAWWAALAALAENTLDVPWAILYSASNGPSKFRVQCRTPAAPDVTVDVWSIESIVQTGRPVLLDDVQGRVGLVPGRDWPEAVARAWVAPIGRPNTPLDGVLVAAISPRLTFDVEYQDFLGLAAGQIASSIAYTRASQGERQRAEALARLDRAKTAFFTNISHEFRTPLTLMLTPLEDLLRNTAALEERADLEMIHRNSLRLLRLVNNLLEFSRIEAERVEACYQPTDVATLTRDLASTFRSAVERAGLRLAVDCAPLASDVYVDREMWEKIVLNLLSNAFKFTINGEISVTVSQHDASSASLVIRDTGVGVPAADVSRVFERFHRVKTAAARTHEGSGIGLALVRELVRLHGGAIRFDSREGHGTTVTVTIPVGAAHLPPAQVGTGKPALMSATAAADLFVEEALRWLPSEGAVEGATRGTFSAAGDRPRVLFVDDNADMRDYVARLLGARYQVATAADGVEALGLIRARPPDVVVTDVMLPHLNGIELLRTLRADAATKSLPIILLSARAGDESKVEGLGAGADDYLAKPFSSGELVARVGTHLALASLRKELARRENTARAAVAAGEEERRRLSRELHDGVGQQITALTLAIERFHTDPPDGRSIAERVKELQQAAEALGRETHRVAVELRPAVLDDMGLVPALQSYAAAFLARHGVQVDFQTVNDGGVRLAPHIETAVYRLVQEALTNVAKHSRATMVTLVLAIHAAEVVAVVEDNGCGFDVDSVLPTSRTSGRLGYVGMTERASLAGGTLHVESSEAGTSVFIRIPQGEPVHEYHH